ncbi:unnamed protein product (mitochondrion) [Plasmodiophora brassicae]|uniref:DYW domain-containing protein n=1 Tax=Plasmodiophora brassicae TaxID=37360 RepID=A0A0G4J3H4_PLABS|nr:hypothetical protein PBRA_002194 [Plasmodiophora brassicae]SPQ98792.1 unnamed protein product [Plasmodiophora brassicae]
MGRPSIPFAIRALRQETDPSRAWSIFDRVLSLSIWADTPFYTSMMSFCKRHLPSKAPEVLSAAVSRGVRITESLFCTFLGACQNATPVMVSEALEWYSKPSTPRSHNVIFGVANLCRVSKHPGLALFLVKDIVDHNVPFTDQLVSILAACCSESKGPIAACTAQQLLDRMQSGQIPRHSLMPTYANLLTTLLAEDLLKSALTVFPLMKLNGVLPSESMCANTIIALLKKGRTHDALDVFQTMVDQSLRVNARVFVTLVAACGRSGKDSAVQALYTYATSKNLIADDFVASAFISAYDHCGKLDLAEDVFRSRGVPDLITSSAMIAAYYHHVRLPNAIGVFERVKANGLHISLEVYTNMLSVFIKVDRVADAMNLFNEMTSKNVRVGIPALASLIAACGRSSNLDSVQSLYRHAENRALVLDDVIASAFIFAFDHCSDVACAERVFQVRQQVSTPHVVTFSSMIAAYNHHNMHAKALETFDNLEVAGLSTSVPVFCSIAAVFVKVGRVLDALRLYERVQGDMSRSRAVMFASLVGACGRYADLPAVQTVHQFAEQDSGLLLKDDAVVGAFVLAYGSWGDLDTAMRLFNGLDVGQYPLTKNAMVTSYARHGMLPNAIAVFEGMLSSSVPISGGTYGTMLSVYGRSDRVLEALGLFRAVVSRSLVVDAGDIASLIASCGRAFDVQAMVQLHGFARERNMLQDRRVISSLVTAYSDCGYLPSAEDVFRTTAAPSTTVINSMIAAYAQHGMLQQATAAFDTMRAIKRRPNDETLLALLTACAHVGDLPAANAFVAEFTLRWRVAMTSLHANCFIDLYGRLGDLDAAERLASSLLIPSAASWAALLNACRRHGDLERAERVVARIQAFPDAGSHLVSAYTLMADLYMSVGRVDDHRRMREEMGTQALTQAPGRATLALPDRPVRHFASNDPMRLPDAALRGAHARLIDTATDGGYLPDLSSSPPDDDNARQSVHGHCTKVAVAYALMKVPPGEPLRLSTTRRICPDCHDFLQRISAVMQCHVSVRDPARHHHFQEGPCSCCGYW